MILALLLATAAAGGDVQAVPAGKTATVTGPAVYMTESRFTEFLVAEESLPICRQHLSDAVRSALEANKQALQAFESVDQRFADDEALILACGSDRDRAILERDAAVRANERLRQQRNVAWGVAGGFLAASAAAIVLALN